MAAVIYLCTRMVVGLSFSERMTAELPVAALETAWGRGYVAEGTVFHSDRGSQYTSKAMAVWGGGALGPPLGRAHGQLPRQRRRR